MRHLVPVLAVIWSACATAPQPRPSANIPAIRHQIDDTIASDPALARRTSDFQYEGPGGPPAAQLPPSRKIMAMGHVTEDRAVVYTRPGATKLEETWVRQPDGWRLAHVTELDAGKPTSASR